MAQPPIPKWRQEAAPGKSLALAKREYDEKVVQVVEAVPIPPMRLKARMSGSSEPMNLSVNLDVARIQSALRLAERGDTWQLFTIYRDMIMGYSHLQAEWAKRKMVIVGQPQSFIPADKKSADDQTACEVIQDMVMNCDNWFDGLMHLLDATLYPVSAAEKIFEPVDGEMTYQFRHPVKYRLKEICPVNYTLFCFKVPYNTGLGVNGSVSYNPDRWESDLNFYRTDPGTGIVDYSLGGVYAPDPARHIIHRGDILGRSFRDNFGGQMRSILFWWLLATQDRDWWGMMMTKYGMPFVVAQVDAQNQQTVDFFTQQLALCTQLGGLVIDKRAKVELQQINQTDGSNAHKLLSDFCNCEVSKIVVGQVLSSTPKNTGLGSGMADQAEEVRGDLRQFDTTKLADTLAKQLFRQYLRINGYRGNPPTIAWGGKKDADALTFAKTIAELKKGGIQPTDEGVEFASDRLGYPLERAPEPVVKAGGGE